MPARSRSQARWARRAYSRGEITKSELDKFLAADYRRLPEKVKPKKDKKKRRKS